MVDVPETHEHNNKDIELQMKAKQEKEILMKEKNMEKASEDYIEALYYSRMCYSKACLEGTTGVVTTILRKMTSNAARYHALNENIKFERRGLDVNHSIVYLQKITL